MNRHRTVTGCLALLLGCLAQPSAQAALDAMQLQLLRPYVLPLRWDNIENSPEWVAGVRPDYRMKQGMHLLHLAAGQSVTVRVPRGEWLRIVAPQQSLHTNALAVMVSDGTGLYVEQTLTESSDGHALLLAPDSGNTRLARVACPAPATCDVAIALFISRHEPLDEIAPYRDSAALDLARVQMGRADLPAPQTYWVFTPKQAVSVELEGPARYVLEHRLVYAPGASELLQTYRVHVRLDAAPHGMLEFTTSTETAAPVYVDGRARVMGRLERGYLEIPAGRHRLELDTDAPLYGRLLRQEQPDYLFPTLNAPLLTALQARDRRLLNSLSPSLWDFADPELRQAITGAPRSIVEREQAAERLARDNSHREGGLLGAMLMQQVADSRPDAPEVQKAASAMLGYDSFYRDLLPLHKLTRDESYYGWFLAPHLADAGDWGRGIAVAEQQMSALAGRVAGGYFVTAPAQNASHFYRLPTRAEPSLLRVIVDRAASMRAVVLKVQYDNQPATTLRLMPGPELPPRQFRLGDDVAGLDVLRWEGIGGTAQTLDGAYGMRQYPAQLLDAAVYELPLPRRVAEVRVWTVAPQYAQASVALQYRAARPFALTESAYLDSAHRIGTQPAAYAAFVRAIRSKPGPESIETELDSHWASLLRVLHAGHQRFTADLSERPPEAGSAVRLSAAEQSTLRRKARAAEQQGQWLVALEAWSPLARAGTGDLRNEALRARAIVLRNLGENYLAEQQLRGLVWYAPDASQRNIALQRLLADYASADDIDAQQTLLAAMLWREPTPALLQRWVAVLVQDQQYDLALQAGLLLPTSERPVSAMLQSAYQLGWWQVFDQLLESVSPEERHIWTGLRAQERQDYNLADHEFAAGAASGKTWQEALRSGLQLREALSTNNHGAMAQRLTDWQNWQARHPGPWQWREEPGMVTDAAGSATLYNPERDLSTRSFRAERDRPVKLTVIGPVTLRIDARPLHPQSGAVPIDSWLRVREPGVLRVFPITGNLPTQGLQLIEDQQHLPGWQVSAVIDIARGVHQLEVNAGNEAVLLRMYAKRPMTPLNVLPPLNRATLAAFITANDRSTDTLPCLYLSCMQIVSESNGRGLVRRGPLSPLQSVAAVSTDHRVINVTAPATTPAAEQNTVMPDWPEAALLAAGDYTHALALPQATGSTQALHRMTLLVYSAEQQPETRAQRLVEAERLAADNPQVSEIQALRSRLASNASWEQISTIQSSAGMRFLPATGWDPESPFLRARTSLFTPLDNDEQLIAADSRLAIALLTTQARRYGLTLRIQDVPYEKAVPMQVYYQLDQEAPHKLVIEPGHPERQIRLDVPAGSHMIYVGLASPIANQFLRVKLDASGVQSVKRSVERGYQVATRQEPIRIGVLGPAWLRIDEWRDGQVLVRYRAVDPGWQLLSFVPEQLRSEALLRIFARTESAAVQHIQSLPRPLEPHTEPVAEPLIVLDEPAAPSRYKMVDEFSLGGQEDGTWSYAGTWQRRRDVTSDSSHQRPEQFLELSATHRYFDEYHRRYFETKLLTRARKDGGPTLGFVEHIDYRPIWAPVNLDVEASVYLQRPGGSGQSRGTEWSTNLLGAVSQHRDIGLKTYHRPRFALQLRDTSLSDAAAYQVGYVDQDVFTPYKAQHHRAWELGDTLVYRPWLDTLWTIGAGVTSNDHLGLSHPDNFALNAKWQQLLGATELELGMRATRYLSDNNRQQAFTSRLLNINLDWEQWCANQHRLELGISLNRDLSKAENFGMLTLIWHTGNGRMYRDFRPGSFDFADLRQRRIPQQKNNQQVPADDE